MPVIDITGQKFGRWTVLRRVENKNGKDAKFLCRCDCGIEKEVLGKNLRNGRSTSCGCYKKEVDSAKLIKWNKSLALDLKGKKYGLLTPIEPTEKRSFQGSVIWKCQCDCGNITYVSVDALRGQHPIRSCGCIKSSRGEMIIQNILEENNIDFIREYQRKEWIYLNTNAHPRYDFYLIKYNRLIEFDGEYHYIEKCRGESLEDRQLKDNIKNQIAKENNIPLVRIPYWERDNITLDMILGDKYLIN